MSLGSELTDSCTLRSGQQNTVSHYMPLLMGYSYSRTSHSCQPREHLPPQGGSVLFLWSPVLHHEPDEICTDKHPWLPRLQETTSPSGVLCNGSAAATFPSMLFSTTTPPIPRSSMLLWHSFQGHKLKSCLWGGQGPANSACAIPATLA